MAEEKLIMDEKTMLRTIARLSHEIIERNADTDEIFLLGIKRKGVPMAKRLKENIEKFSDMTVNFAEIDTSAFRDDNKSESRPEKPNLPFDINDKIVILTDDVIQTGRTTRAAIEAVIACGRPAAVQFCVMVDRGHRELPVSANYVGKNIPTSKNEFVSVKFEELDGKTEVAIVKQ